MKSFLERSPIVIGIIALAIITAGTVGSILLDGGVFSNTYRAEAEFVDAAGLREGDSILIAGVRSGEVAAVAPGPNADTVIVELDVNAGVRMPRNTRAEIKVDTVLGSKSISLRLPDEDLDGVAPDWSVELKDADRIAVANTKTPFEAIDLQDVGTDLAVETDAVSLNKLIDSLAEITDGTKDDLTAVVDNLNNITTAVNVREDEARDLLEAAAELSTTLADRDTELVTLIDELARVVDNLDDQSDELIILLEETAATSDELGDLLGDHRGDLDAIFDDLQSTLEVIDRRQVDLATGIAYSASAIEGFSGIGYSTPDRVAHPWANIFLQGAGPAGIEPILGACGVFDIALDVVFGPDPLPCDQRDGSLSAASAHGDATVFNAEDGTSATMVAWMLERAGVRP